MDTGWRALAAAVVLQALRDASGAGYRTTSTGQADARTWLAGPEAAELAMSLHIDAGLARWLHQDTPKRIATPRPRRRRGDGNAKCL